VSDLGPLSGMPLTYLHCSNTQVSDLSPLKGMPLTDLYCSDTSVSDLSPLEGAPLRNFRPPPEKQLTPESLQLIEKLKKRGCSVVW